MINQVDRNNLSLAAEQCWNELVGATNYLEQEEVTLLELAFTQMVIAHQEQRRKNGDFYIVHPTATAILLAELKLPAEVLAAALLHDVPEDTNVTIKQLLKEFGPEIVALIEGVTKYSVIKYRGEQRYAENLRKMFIAMNRDIRIVFIKLADRIHNLMTIQQLREDKKKRIAQESLEIYAPIAERLGISKFRTLIEELSFPIVYPDEYKKFKQLSQTELVGRSKSLEKHLKSIKELLKHSNIPILEVKGRVKSYYSLYKKMKFKSKSIEQIYDLIAVRIITDTVEHCYTLLSYILQKYETLPERTKDYIAKPKENGYQSIHSTIQTKNGEYLELQIRTQKMDEYAEYGIAAHLNYKQGLNLTDTNAEQRKWIQNLVELGKKWIKRDEYIRRVKINLYNDKIFVMTPKGDVVELDNGATSLDFAFKIHEDIGKTATMAMINGKSAKLETMLHNGDIVEIITKKNQTPRWDWLQKVRTSSALKKIRQILSFPSQKK